MKRFGIWLFFVVCALAGAGLGQAAHVWGIALVQAICLFGCFLFAVNFSMIGFYAHSLERKYGKNLYMGEGGFFFDEE